MAGDAPSTLRFADRRRDGLLEVSGRDGSPVAFVDRPRFGQRLTACARDGSVLCRVRRRHVFSRYLDLRAGDGSSLGHLKEGGRRHQVVLHDGRRLQLSLRWFGQGWVLVDEAGIEVLSSVRRAAGGRSREQLETGRNPEGSRSIHGHHFTVETFIKVGPDDWLVTPDGSLGLPQIVAIVEAYRLVVKAARNRDSA